MSQGEPDIQKLRPPEQRFLLFIFGSYERDGGKPVPAQTIKKRIKVTTEEYNRLVRGLQYMGTFRTIDGNDGFATFIEPFPNCAEIGKRIRDYREPPADVGEQTKTDLQERRVVGGPIGPSEGLRSPIVIIGIIVGIVAGVCAIIAFFRGCS